MLYPTGYLAYVKHLKARGERPDPNIAKFATRYRMARGIVGIEIDGTTQITERAYASLLRLSLAYSAFEMLSSAIGSNTIPVLNAALALTLRDGRERHLVEYLLVSLDNPRDARARRMLKRFLSTSGDSNVRPVIEAIRHLTFHGAINPSAARLRSAYAVAALHALTESICAAMDTEMERISRTTLKS